MRAAAVGVFIARRLQHHHSAAAALHEARTVGKHCLAFGSTDVCLRAAHVQHRQSQTLLSVIHGSIIVFQRDKRVAFRTALPL
jgi:dTDP-4-dehydrorhamnose 3,5-epimerase-like enzyme